MPTNSEIDDVARAAFRSFSAFDASCDDFHVGDLGGGQMMLSTCAGIMDVVRCENLLKSDLLFRWRLVVFVWLENFMEFGLIEIIEGLDMGRNWYE